MVSALFFYQLGLIALVWLCFMLQWAWPSDTAVCPPPLEPHPHGPSARVSPHPLWASPTNRIATPVHMGVTPAHTPLQPHPRASS